MSTPAKTMLGLSIHSDQICLIEMSDGLIQSIAYRELDKPFDLEAFRSEGELLNNQSEVLKDLYERTSGKGKEVGVVLHTGMVFIKKIPVSLGLEEEMIREHMQWEAGQFLIAPLDDYIVEYQRLPFQTSSGNPVYLLILVRKSVVEWLHSLLGKIGLFLKKVDVDAFSNIRALLANYDLDMEKISVLVDVQRESLAFVFIHQQEYFLSHRISLQEGGAASGFLDSSDVVSLLLKELRRLIFGHSLGRGIEDLDRIFLVGTDLVQRISQELLSSISIPLEVVNPFRRVNVSQSVSQSEEFIGFPERFLTSIGVTLD